MPTDNHIDPGRPLGHLSVAFVPQMRQADDQIAAPGPQQRDRFGGGKFRVVQGKAQTLQEPRFIEGQSE